MTTDNSRRHFLKKAALATSAIVGFPAIVPAHVLGKDAPSNKINIAQIGCGRIAHSHDLPDTMRYEVARVVAACDVDAKRLQECKQLIETWYTENKGKKNYVNVKTFEDYREMLQDKDIDAVICRPFRITMCRLFSVRMDPDLAVTNGGIMVNAEDEKGEKATFGQSSPWMDYYGTRGNGAIEGIAILQHPENKWFSAPWFTRDYGFFSPTPMNWPQNDESIRLKKGETIDLKYRVIVHAGVTESAGIAEAYQQWVEE